MTANAPHVESVTRNPSIHNVIPKINEIKRISDPENGRALFTTDSGSRTRKKTVPAMRLAFVNHGSRWSLIHVAPAKNATINDTAAIRKTSPSKNPPSAFSFSISKILPVCDSRIHPSCESEAASAHLSLRDFLGIVPKLLFITPSVAKRSAKSELVLALKRASLIAVSNLPYLSMMSSLKSV